jgi:hypothetical protein
MGSQPVNYNFDEEIDRRAVPALKTHPLVLSANGENLFAAGVAGKFRKKAWSPYLTDTIPQYKFLDFPG